MDDTKEPKTLFDAIREKGELLPIWRRTVLLSSPPIYGWTNSLTGEFSKDKPGGVE